MSIKQLNQLLSCILLLVQFGQTSLYGLGQRSKLVNHLLQDTHHDKDVEKQKLIMQQDLLGQPLNIPRKKVTQQGWTINQFSPPDRIVDNPGIGLTNFNQITTQLSFDQHPKANLIYYRPYWKEIEPQEGKIDFQKIETLFQAAEQSNQLVAFRIMMVNGTNGIPTWLMEKGIKGKSYFSKEDKQKKFMPDFSDPRLMSHAQSLIKRLGERLDGHPLLDHVDIGLMGHYGEWHVYQTEKKGYTMPKFKIKKRYIDWHLNAFKQTPLLMLIDDQEGLAYGIKHGTGWRADSFGDTNYHHNFYIKQLIHANARDIWKTKPVAFEIAGEFPLWEKSGKSVEDVRTILNYGLNAHVSIINGKSSAIPRIYRPLLNEFLKRVGYRFALLEISHPQSVVQGQALLLTTVWENQGVAPIYRPVQLVYRLSRQGKTIKQWSSSAIIQSWLPGEHLDRQQLVIPKSCLPGQYQIDVAMIPSNKKLQPLNLAMNQPNHLGWYNCSSVNIK